MRDIHIGEAIRGVECKVCYFMLSVIGVVRDGDPLDVESVHPSPRVNCLLMNEGCLDSTSYPSPVRVSRIRGSSSFCGEPV